MTNNQFIAPKDLSPRKTFEICRGKPCKEAGPCVVGGRLWGRGCGGAGWLWESPVPVLQGVCAVGVLCPRAFCRGVSPFYTSVWWKGPLKLAMFSLLAANVKAHLNLCERWDEKVDKWIAPFLTGSILYHGFMQCATFQLNSSVIFFNLKAFSDVFLLLEDENNRMKSLTGNFFVWFMKKKKSILRNLFLSFIWNGKDYFTALHIKHIHLLDKCSVKVSLDT